MHVSYGLVGVVGIGRKFSKPLVCISTLLHMCQGCPTEVCFPGTQLCPPSVLLSPVNAILPQILPNSRTLDGYPPPSKLVSNFIFLFRH